MQAQPRPQIKLRTRLLPALVILLLALRLLFPYKGWTTLLVGLCGAWLFSYLWARSLARGLILRRQLRGSWAQVGDRLDQRFTLANNGWAPTPVPQLDPAPAQSTPGRAPCAVSGAASRWSGPPRCARATRLASTA